MNESGERSSNLKGLQSGVQAIERGANFRNPILRRIGLH
jgi:hypothetical protein